MTDGMMAIANSSHGRIIIQLIVGCAIWRIQDRRALKKEKGISISTPHHKKAFSLILPKRFIIPPGNVVADGMVVFRFEGNWSREGAHLYLRSYTTSRPYLNSQTNLGNW